MRFNTSYFPTWVVGNLHLFRCLRKYTLLFCYSVVQRVCLKFKRIYTLFHERIFQSADPRWIRVENLKRNGIGWQASEKFGLGWRSRQSFGTLEEGNWGPPWKPSTVSRDARKLIILSWNGMCVYIRTIRAVY